LATIKQEIQEIKTTTN